MGQTEHSAQFINMALNNSNFQTTGRGFSGGGKVAVIKPSLARGGSCILQQTQETGHSLIARESRDAVVRHCVRSVRFVLVFSNYKVNSLDTSSFYILMAYPLAYGKNSGFNSEALDKGIVSSKMPVNAYYIFER